MLRRKLTLLTLAAATLLATACASPTAPSPTPRQECVNTQGGGVCH